MARIFENQELILKNEIDLKNGWFFNTKITGGDEWEQKLRPWS